MKSFIKIFFLIYLFVLISLSVYSQGAPPPPPDRDGIGDPVGGGAPIGGGSIILIILGSGYLIYKLKNIRDENS